MIDRYFKLWEQSNESTKAHREIVCVRLPSTGEKHVNQDMSLCFEVVHVTLDTLHGICSAKKWKSKFMFALFHHTVII